jgi:hypothetical protein
VIALPTARVSEEGFRRLGWNGVMLLLTPEVKILFVFVYALFL